MGSKIGVVLGHLLLFAGLYVVTWGIVSLTGHAGIEDVVERPLLWGLLVLSAAAHPLLGVGRRKVTA